MNDQEIRKILISYLQAQNVGCRVYNEKSIGDSVCDVMLVTDRLLGFEIKGDGDDLRRLEHQIDDYNTHFDECYIVVGDAHESRIEQTIPDWWGIIVVLEDKVAVRRKATNSPGAFPIRSKQLEMLWRLELKNILMRNNHPIFAERNNSYIIQYLIDHTPDGLLRAQIADELRMRDLDSVYADAVEAAPVSARSIYLEALDALSEEKDITLDEWIELFGRAKAARKKKRQALEISCAERPPHSISYTDIEPTLGAPWIDEHIISEFITYLLDDGSRHWGVGVSHEKVTGNWSVHNKQYRADGNIRATQVYGTHRYNALYILEALLNLREIRLRPIDGGSGTDVNATLAALEKSRLIAEEFKNWVWQSEDRIWEIEEAYNAMFASLGQARYDGSGLLFPSLSEKFALYPYQKDAVAKILDARNTLLAFDVGAGKTFIMIAAAMKLRQEGLSRRNMFVVPNNLVGQWEKMFLDLYPLAKVLAIEPKNFTPAKRAKVLTQIRDGDYDGVVIAYSCFEMIQLSSEAVMDNLGQQISKINHAYNACRYDYTAQTALERQKKYFQKLAEELVASMAQKPLLDVTFDDLCVETLFLDEAHNYKNLPIRTKMRNLNGINVKGSQKCYDLLQKVRYVQTHGRGAVFATGTPLCNSIADAYAFQVYLQYEELERINLSNFDDWVKTFARPEQSFEIDVTASGYRMVNRFARFHNLPELVTLFSQIAVFYANSQIQDLPELVDVSDTCINASREFKAYMRTIVERTEEIRKHKIDPRYDNMLKVSTDGRKAALDLRLVGCHQPRGRYSKVERCVENALDLYRKYPGTTQLVFCDYSTPKSKEFDVYNELRTMLIEQGVPPHEIAFIHSYKTEAEKRRLFKAFNNAEIRVLIGSTFKLGIGANVQQRLKAIHHLDVPWRPADMVQREGRMIRSGNENESVGVYRYIVKGSFDSYSWQLLERKQRFISQFLSGTTYQRTASDLEQNVLTYGEVKALAVSNPLMKRLAEKENELSNLMILAMEEQRSLDDARSEIADLKETNESLETRIAATEQNARYVAGLGSDAIKEMCSGFAAEIEDARKRHDGEAAPCCKNEFCLEFPVDGEEPENTKPHVYLSRLNEKYEVRIGDSLRGNVTRLGNFFKKLDDYISEMRDSITENAKRKNDLERYLDTYVEEYPAKLRECEQCVEEIRMELQ